MRTAREVISEVALLGLLAWRYGLWEMTIVWFLLTCIYCHIDQGSAR